MLKEVDIRKEVLKLKTGFTPKEIGERFKVDSNAVTQVLDILIEEGFRFVNDGDTFIRTRSKEPSKRFEGKSIFPGREFTFGVVSDPHLGNKLERLDELNKMYDIFKQEGISVVYNCGDNFDGVNVFNGQEFEVHKHGQQEQIDYFVEKYPKREGIKTYAITGNHCLRAYEHGGCDPMVAAANRRKDIVYLGQYDATVKLRDEVTLELMHPAGNVPYALSYKPQRDINNRSPEDLPNALFYGHYHTSIYMHYRGIDFLQVPCFKAAGAWEHRMGLNPTIGGWIVSAKSNGETLNSFNPRLVTFPVDTRNRR